MSLTLLAGKTAAQGHDHTLSIGVSIGPLVLRVALLATVPAVAGFAMLRGVLPPQSRRTTALVAGGAGAMVVLTLLLAGGIDFPDQLVVLVLAATAAPLFPILSRDSRSGPAARGIRALAPWMLSLAGIAALVEFGRAWLGHWDTKALTVVLYTGVTLALVSLSWFTVCQPRRRLFRMVVQGQAVVLAIVLVGGAAQATVLRQAGSTPVPPVACPPQTPSCRAARSVPSTRAAILANAMSRDVDVSSANGENPQSSQVPSRSTGMYCAALSTRSRTWSAVSTRGSIGSVTPTNTWAFPGRWSRMIASTRSGSCSLASWT